MISIRKMLPQDRSAIYEILQQTDMFTMPEISVAMDLIDAFLFNKEQKDYLIFVVTTGHDEVVGYICFGPTPATEGTFDIYWIAIAPYLQKKGIGKELLKFVENQIIEKNGRIIIVETSSQQKYALTKQFYLKNSYNLEARIKDFYRFGDDRLIFVKRLYKPIENKENGKMAENLRK
jgi:ribosomal protein S18 acetylase RimI-like enzyme